MKLLVVIVSTLLFVADCAFVFLPTALGSVPGQPLARGIAPAPDEAGPAE